MTRALPPGQVLQSIINDPNVQGLQQSIPRLAGVFAQRGRQQRLVDLSRAAGDSSNPQGQINALNELAVLNPQSSQAISQGIQQRQGTLKDLHTARIEKAENDLAFTASYGRAIKNAKTDEQKNSIYQRFLTDAKIRDVELDPKITPQNYYEGMEEFYINPIIDQAESLGLVEEIVPLSSQGKRAFDIEQGFLKADKQTRDPEKVEADFKNATILRKEFTKNSGDFIKQRDAFDRVLAAAEESSLPGAPRGAGDLALIFNYMKVLDPGSTVREGEFATAQNSGSLPQTIIAKYNKVIQGGRLEDNLRKDFVERSGKLFNKALGSQKRRVKQFTDIAERNNLSVQDVVLDLIGDSAINVEALTTIQQETQQPTAATQQPTTQRIRRYNAQTGKIE